MQRFHAFSDARPNANSSRLVLGRVWLLLAAMLVLGNSFTSALHQDGACWFHGPLAAHRYAPGNASTVEFDRTPSHSHAAHSHAAHSHAAHSHAAHSHAAHSHHARGEASLSAQTQLENGDDDDCLQCCLHSASNACIVAPHSLVWPPRAVSFPTPSFARRDFAFVSCFDARGPPTL